MGKIVQTAGRNALGEFAPEFAHFNDDVLFGENWNNQDIDVKTRSIITVVALMASGITDSSLKYHLQNAKNHGVTQKEIAAVITHVAFYAGWPKAWAVFNLAKEVWETGEGDLPYEEEAMAGINETLEKMGLDYLDMMIIHSPQPWAKVNQCEDRYVEGNRAAWKALEDAYEAGKLKAIGISNFQIEDIASLLETAKIKPMVNQILLHISNTPMELVEYCRKNNIVVEAYSPIAHGEILNQPEITAIAEYSASSEPLCPLERATHSAW
ncbi:aldo/keto reductase [Anaerovoracaceae bacterium SGI.174]